MVAYGIRILDVIGFRFGIHYGHRGFTHSLAFALCSRERPQS